MLGALNRAQGIHPGLPAPLLPMYFYFQGNLKECIEVPPVTPSWFQFAGLCELGVGSAGVGAGGCWHPGVLPPQTRGVTVFLSLF